MVPKIFLKSKKDEPVRRFHPWVFRGAVKSVEGGDPVDGDWVEVYSNKGSFLAAGHFQSEGSIVVRLIKWEPGIPDDHFWSQRIRDAFQLRRSTILASDGLADVYRLVYAEGDHLPGLIIDCYGGNFVIQCHSAGMMRIVDLIARAIHEVYGPQVKTIYHKTEHIRQHSAIESSFLYGRNSGAEVIENGIRFHVDWEKGQKTGFFIDQRDNRKLLSSICAGKKVLNTFCYTGGFSLAALQGGAALVHSVDSSSTAIDMARQNLILNGFDPEKHVCMVSDTLDYLKGNEELYDVVVLDPPAYAKHMSARHNAVQGYKRLNATAMSKMPGGSLLMTFSCSQVVDRKLFESTIMAAALAANRKALILARLSQPSDHPVSLFHPEGEYLKGLLLLIQ